MNVIFIDSHNNMKVNNLFFMVLMIVIYILSDDSKKKTTEGIFGFLVRFVTFLLLYLMEQLIPDADRKRAAKLS